jgi:biotin operon repressor
MIPYQSTPVPNIIFDAYLPILKPTEVTLLFIIIRQTIGWIDLRTKKRKDRDWLAGSQLRQKTGYSRKAISTAINTLVKHKLVIVYDHRGNKLLSPKDRQGKTCLYYGYNQSVMTDLNPCIPPTCVNSTQYMRSFYAQQKKLLQKKMTLPITTNKHYEYQ